jgi:hypothetical protein
MQRYVTPSKLVDDSALILSNFPLILPILCVGIGHVFVLMLIRQRRDIFEVLDYFRFVFQS